MLLVAASPLVVACGGRAVDDAGGTAAPATTGGDTPAGAGGAVTATSTGGDVLDGAGGSVTLPTSSELREAASARAARFVNDYDVPCMERKLVTFPGADRTSAYPTRVLQTRGRGAPYLECVEIADADEHLACWERLACDFEWWNELDWSQFSPDATVVEIVGPRPEQINVVRTIFGYRPSDPQEEVQIEYVSFYEDPREEPVPPGCHDCGYYWYLDATPEGIALVLSPPMAGELEGALPFTELDLCLTE